MEYAPNQLEAKAVEPVVEVVVINPLEPDEVVVINPLEPEINFEILRAFAPMDVDTVFNHADADLDVG
nr:hypothetical protein [Tanacetum cinerariifolium]